MKFIRGSELIIEHITHRGSDVSDPLSLAVNQTSQKPSLTKTLSSFDGKLEQSQTR